MAVTSIKAQQLRDRFAMRTGLLALRTGVRREGQVVVAVQRLIGKALLQRLWDGWMLLVQMTRERHEADAYRRDFVAAAHADCCALRRSLECWQKHAEHRRFEASVATKKQDLWQKVHGWLDELGEASL